MRFNFIDICYPDNLSDHHGRDNEQLLAISWYEEMTDREAIEDFVLEAYALDNEDLWSHLPKDDEQCRVALTQIITDEIIGMDLSMPDGGEPDEMMIYGYLSW